jgi:signal peptidase II
VKNRIDWRTLTLFFIAGIVIALDQYTKHLVRAYIPVYTSWMPIAWLEPFVTFTHVENTGAAFGLFKSMSYVFVGVAVVVVVLISIYHKQIAGASWMLRVAFGLQMGGAAGNAIDRILRNGVVTDFVDVRIWPIWNVADSAVVVGTALLAYYALFMDRERPAAAEGAVGPAGGGSEPPASPAA